VPQKIGSMQVLSNNRIGLADCTEGYPNITIEAVTEEIDPTSVIDPLYYTAYHTPTPMTNAWAVMIRFIGDPALAATSSSTQAVYIKTNIGEYYVYMSDDLGRTAYEVTTYLAQYITDNIVPIDSAVVSASSSGPTVVIIGTANLLLARGLWFPSYVKGRSFPSGTNYFGIVYFDQFGRCGGVNIGDGLSINSGAGLSVAYI